ncbi:MAG: family 10 glycosylhydrolase [Microcoleaceae cyanobacterium]
MHKKRFRKSLFNWILTGLILLILSLGIIEFNTSNSPQVLSKPPQEVRGVWMTNVNSGVLFMPWAIDRALNQLSQLQFNTVYPVVWNRGTTFYRSAVARRVTGKAQDDLLNLVRFGGDILSKIVREGHQKGLRIIPWFEYGFMAPIHSSLVRYHPDWVALPKNQQSKPIYSQADLDQTNSSKASLLGIHNIWLNPLHPRVQQFIKDLILEVVMKYDVDGIQLDDHFGMPVELGYDWFTLKLYQEEHQGKMPPDDPYNAEWMRWRSNKITAFVTTLVKEIKAVKPNCIISLSPNPKGTAYREYLQDWQTWVNQGLIEELIVQIYRNDSDSFIKELNDPAIQQTRQKIPVSIGILTGTLGHTVDIKTIEQQVKAVRNNHFNGISFFYWESLWSYITPNAPQQRRRIFQQLLSTPAQDKA